VGERVHAGGGGHARGQVEGELRVGEDGAREERGVEDDLLHARLVVGDHGGTPHLAARAAGGGQRDEVGQGVRDRANLRMVPGVLQDVAFVHGHQRDRLGDVERGAPAESDDGIGRVRLEGAHAVDNLLARRVAMDAGIDLRVEGREAVAEVAQDRECRQSPVGDDERAFHAGALEVVGDQAARAGAEMDRGGKRERGNRHVDCGSKRRQITPCARSSAISASA
jgi:hypothetical protein